MMKMPMTANSMTLQFNDHKSVHDTAEQWIVDNADWASWKDEEAKERAVLTDSIWTLQVYPFTPIGFYCFAAPTLEEVLELANAEDAKYQPTETK